jgi:hypothetical protein
VLLKEEIDADCENIENTVHLLQNSDCLISTTSDKYSYHRILTGYFKMKVTAENNIYIIKTNVT